MAELLIRQYDNHRPGKNVQQTVFGYRTHDPVVAMPDGHGWGSAELDGTKFCLIQIPAASAESVAPFIQPETVLTREPDGDVEAPVNRRAWCVDPALLPATRAAEYAAGQTTLRDDEFLKAMVHKLSGQTAWARGYRLS